MQNVKSPVALVSCGMEYICKIIIDDKSTPEIDGNGLTEVISDVLIDAEDNRRKQMVEKIEKLIMGYDTQERCDFLEALEKNIIV